MFFNDKTSRTSRSNIASIRGTEQEDASDRRRRRVPRACDMCRLKKLKCEGGHPSRKACINCVMTNYDCTYLQMARNELRDKAYVQNLEMRLESMEKLVRKWCPDPETSQDLLDNHVTSATNTARNSPAPSTAPSTISSGPRPSEISTAVDGDDVDSDEDEASVRRTVSHYLQGIHLNSPVPPLVGKSSTMMLLRTVLDSKNGEPSVKPAPVNGTVRENAPRFWESYTWETRPSGPRHQFVFPDDDLIPILVDNYFNNGNTYSPLLHRPTFERNVARGLHLSDEGFGATLLLVCALGSREVEDPRVYLLNEELGYMRGGRWFIQVQKTLRFVMFEQPRLYDLQIAALAAIYATRTSSPQLTCWLIVGHGIRMAQVLGAHRRKVYASIPPIERELMKRAFWSLIKLDRNLGYYTGRPCTIRDEDFDVELPVECDDEYWVPEDPALAFKQPEGKPAKIMFFNWGIKLNQIQSYAMRTIYSITKAKVALGHVGNQWQERTVMELDSALNQWLDSLPEPLRWDPKEKDFTTLTQTAGLHAEFYDLRMIIHRPFVSHRSNKSTGAPSLTICTNAARSALRILDVQFLRAKEENKQGIGLIGTMVVAGMLLLLNVLSSQRKLGTTVPLDMDIELIHKAAFMLMALDNASQATRTASDALVQLIGIGGLPVPRASDSPYRRDASPHTSNDGIWEAPPLSAPRPTTASRAFATTGLASQPAQNLGSWNPAAVAGPPTQGFFGGSTGNVPQSANTVDDFLRTLEGLSAYRTPAAPSVPGDPTYNWSPPVREEGGVGNLGFQWEEWSGMFASAFGVEGPDSSGRRQG